MKSWSSENKKGGQAALGSLDLSWIYQLMTIVDKIMTNKNQVHWILMTMLYIMNYCTHLYLVVLIRIWSILFYSILYKWQYSI